MHRGDSAGPERPGNLLFILSDQHNRDTLGCYGHPLVETPCLDALAARGVRFNSAYCNSPLCVPSRASLATGRYVHQTGYWDNASPYDGRVPGWGHRLMEAGHRVDAIGKLHYRGVEDPVGFSRTLLPMNVVDGIGDVMGSVRDATPVYEMERADVENAGPGVSASLDYDADVAGLACDWLKRRARSSSRHPWMLFVSFVSPHPPFVAPSELYERYPPDAISLPVQYRPGEQPQHPSLAILRRTLHLEEPFTDEQIRRATATYYAMCTYVDRQVGRVLSTLQKLGLADNTRVIYTSDHGESMGRRGLWGKFTLYEESVAVPMILAGPGVPRGEVSSEIVSLVDCYPTMVEALGHELKDAERELPGRSLWPIVRGGSGPGLAFSEYHAVGSTSASYMLRERRYKYIHHVGERPQLFDLESDPRELNDLSADPDSQEVVTACERRLRALVDPEGVDAAAKADQRVLIERHGGREKVIQRGTFGNTPVPGQNPDFHGSAG